FPITKFLSGCGAPVIHRGQITQSSSGGAIKGGKIYRLSVCAITADGQSSPASEPLYVATTPDTDTHTITLTGISWPIFNGLSQYVVFASDQDDLICMQATGTLTGDSTGYSPTSITLTGGPY